MKMFNKRELETIKWALHGELKRSKSWRDEKVGAEEARPALNNICSDLQRLIDKTIKILAGTGALWPSKKRK